MPERKYHCDVLVIGAGPAGIAAATHAAESGCNTILLDMQAHPGGQIWRGQWPAPSDPTARIWLERLAATPMEQLFGARIIAVPQAGKVIAEDARGALAIAYHQAVIATGARELLLPFPGWTLPGVTGAGGLQALVKNGLPVEGKRVVVAGSGPLLLAAADTLVKAQAEVVCIVEQAAFTTLARFACGLLGAPAKLAQTLRLLARLRGVRYRKNSWVVRASGRQRLAAVTLQRRAKREEIRCDYLACGFGLVPNLDVASAFGCAIEGGFVRVDKCQATSVADVYCAGETTGIGGVDKALLEGRIAGMAVAGRYKSTSGGGRFGQRRFARSLLRTFRLRSELHRLADDDTLICRCEDVAFGALRDCASQREAKLMTRVGMGYCQGRICGAACTELFGWARNAERAPLAPIRIGKLHD
jgi:D-hydroxyproline dehydrogenase subunit alpha